jgi:hypothetical protein
MCIINQGLLCRHQYRILIQSNKAMFNASLIHTRWFNSIPSDTTSFITINKGERNYTSIPLSYINQLRTTNVFTPAIREQISKKVKFGTAMSVAKTSIQVAVMEDTTAELIGILTQFIMKYRRNTGLGIENTQDSVLFTNTISQDLQNSSESIQEIQQPLINLPEVSNPEYHKPKGRPPKRYKAATEVNHVTSGKSDDVTVQKTCSYCSEKGHNIRGCLKHKADSSANKENEYRG